ncbi:MAG: hypothetical protein DRJ07_02690 [Bacteroidetes bacterium]|nr:MAG: hypothetical protein DRJ07_02690 [Bacteroidota bacterium]
MEDYIKINTIELTKNLTREDYQIFSRVLYSKKGIIKFSTNENILRLEFNSYLIALNEIQDLITGVGYTIKETKKINRLQKFIQNLSKTNQESFGSGKLECCILNE